MHTVIITVDGTQYRMTRDGIEAFVDGEWNPPNADTPDAGTVLTWAVFTALEQLDAALNGTM